MQAERGTHSAEPFAHLAVAYGSAEEYVNLIVPALIDGLRRGDRIMLIAREENLERVTATLGHDMRRLRAARSQEWYAHPARTLAESFAYARQGPPALMIGEPLWHRERDIAEWARIEGIVNLVFAGIRGTAICVYRRPEGDVLRTHPRYLDVGGVRASARYAPPDPLAWPEPSFPPPPPQAYTMDFDLPRVRQLRAFVRERAVAAGLSGDRVDSLVLAAAEIAANAVEHGAGYGTAQMWIGDGDLICEITNPDGGLAVPFPGYIPPEEESPRGYGLWISRQLCDRMDLRTVSGISQVRLHMSL